MVVVGGATDGCDLLRSGTELSDVHVLELANDGTQSLDETAQGLDQGILVWFHTDHMWFYTGYMWFHTDYIYI
jgi:hypothetical protein